MKTSEFPSLVEELIKWLETNSGTFHRQGIDRMRDLLIDRLKGLPGELTTISHLPIELIDGTLFDPGDSIHWSLNPHSKCRILLSGHYDTVFDKKSRFQETKWLDDEKLSGPGIADMKGGLLILIEAVTQFLTTNSTPQIGMEILLTADEEIGSPASLSTLESVSKNCQMALVFESSLEDRSLIKARAGSGVYQITALGKTAHSGRDFASGINAIVGLSQILTELNNWNHLIPNLTLNIGRISGGGPLNQVPDLAEAWINVRSFNPESAESFDRDIHEWIATKNQQNLCNFKVKGAFSRPPLPDDLPHQTLRDFWNTVEGELKYAPSGVRETGGSSDGNCFAHFGLAVLDGIGIVGGEIHSEREFAFIPSINEQIAKTVAFLNKWESGQWNQLLPQLKP